MRNGVGSTLTLVSSIIDFIIAVGIILVAMGFSIGFGVTRLSNLVSFVAVIAALILIILGIFLWKISEMMRSPNRRRARNGAIWAIILGVLTIGNVSGILAVIGGIIGLIEEK